MPLSWKDSLFQKLNLFRALNSELPRIYVMGIGNDLRGDDPAGLIVARQLLADGQTARLSTGSGSVY